MIRPDTLAPVLRVEQRILVIRDQKVMIDTDLAELYGVPTKALNQAVKRNVERFPADFMFQLTWDEAAHLRSQSVTLNDELDPSSRSQSVTLKQGGNVKYRPYVFTEQGVAMLSSVLKSAQAIAVNIEIMRTFVRVRELAATHGELALRLNDLEEKAEALALQHNTFAHNTRTQLKQVFEAIRQLMTPPDPPSRPIGFVIETKDGKNKAAKGKT